MIIDSSIGLGLILGVAFWAAVIGGATALAAWALIMFGSTAREIGKARTRGRETEPGVATTVTGPAEEGGRLDEWGEDRLDRAA